MKKIKKIALFSLLIFSLSACEKFLDVNEDPNYPAEVEDFLLLPAVQASVGNVFAADYGLLGSFWAQHWTQNNTSSQYKIYETYTLSNNSNAIDRPYRELYFGGLADNEIMHLKALEEENWGVYLMTSTMKAFTFQTLVDLYDNVPYTEAFKGESELLLNPKIDAGQEVYTAIYTLLNEALSKDFTDENVFNKDVFENRYEDFDLFFEADIDDWIAFANTVKLRILLRQYAANTSFATTELTALLADGTFLDKDVAYTNFENSDSKSNPLFETDQLQLNTEENIKACATFISYLTANSDARMGEMFEVVGGDIIGMVPGSYEVPSTLFEAPDVISNPILTATMPAYLMTHAETELLLAEANLRLGNVAEAQTHYEAGVTSSFDRIGADIDIITETDTTSLLTTAYVFPPAGFEAQLKAIIMQKWIDAADGQRGMEAFIEQVRTGYPEKSLVSSQIQPGYELPGTYIPGTLIYSKKGTTDGIFPVRLPYPASELNFNSNAAEYKALNDAAVMQTKVWWNK